MILKILTNEKMFPSAKLLRDKLSTILNMPILVTSDPNKINSPFIRYGNSSSAIKSTKNCLGLNSPNFIMLASNKLAFSSLMQREEIPSPIYYKTKKPEIFPVLIRKTLRGFGGEGILVISNIDEFKKEWGENYYWTPYVKTRFELRVHILGGVPVKVFRKKREDGMKEEEFPIRNNNRGYHFSKVDNLEKFPKIVEISKKLSDILVPMGGFFFSADIGWDIDNKRYFIFEVNSASGLNENTAELYATYLAKELLNRNLVAENKLQLKGE